MDFENILHAVVSLTAMGLLFGIILGIAAKVFAVETDPRIEQITQALPGANCGGCGYAGCANFADAVVRGAAPTNGCMVGGAQVAAQVAAVMGQEPLEVIPQDCRCQVPVKLRQRQAEIRLRGLRLLQGHQLAVRGLQAVPLRLLRHGRLRARLPV